MKNSSVESSLDAGFQAFPALEDSLSIEEIDAIIREEWAHQAVRGLLGSVLPKLPEPELDRDDNPEDTDPIVGA
jgi:hypothetical protein